MKITQEYIHSKVNKNNLIDFLRNLKTKKNKIKT